MRAEDAEDDGHDLESLAAQARRGDEKAFGGLVDRTHRTVYALVLRMVGTDTDAAPTAFHALRDGGGAKAKILGSVW